MGKTRLDVTRMGLAGIADSTYFSVWCFVALQASPGQVRPSTAEYDTVGQARFHIEGLAPLVIHRFSAKIREEMKCKMETGNPASSRKKRMPKSTDDLFMESRYMSPEGWDGFHASALRCAAISACRLVGFKMTLAKLSIFIESDGQDAQEPQIPLIRIFGAARKQEDIARVETGQPYVTVRAAFYPWQAEPIIRWDRDQFTSQDITNLIHRIGLQVGICEGRPDSKNSAGMGWGLFQLTKMEE